MPPLGSAGQKATDAFASRVPSPALFAQLIGSLHDFHSADGCPPAPNRNQHKKSLREGAGWFSYLIMSFATVIINLGKIKELQVADLESLSYFETPWYRSRSFEDSWRKELLRAQANNIAPSIFWTLIRSNRLALIQAALQVSVLMALRLAQIVYFKKLILFYSDSSVSFEYGIGICVVFLLCNLLAILVQGHQVLWVMHIGLRMKTELTTAVYNKLLRMPVSSFQTANSSTGKAVNMISSDFSVFIQFMLYVNYLWLGPVLAVVITSLLATDLGWSALAGIGLYLILFLPLQHWVGNRYAILQKLTSKLGDSRVKLINEVLLGNLVMKLFSWERSACARINAVRDEELNSRQRSFYVQAANECIGYISGSLMAFTCFITFVATGNTLTPDIVFSTISFLQAFKLSAIDLSSKGVRYLGVVKVVCQRVEDFLMEPELQSSTFLTAPGMHPFLAEAKAKANQRDLIPSTTLASVPPVSTHRQPAIEMKNAYFSWAREALHPSLPSEPGYVERQGRLCTDSVLRDVNLHVAPGQLLGIVGAIGSGKSSLFAAILGELPVVSGEFCLRGRVSYASQKAWIFSASVRDNILFGRDFDAQRYNQVIFACCLDKDLQALPAGDNTFIGERGVNLSGGQQARVALARTIYSDADIYLFDGVLSAVDPQVARLIFERALSNSGFLSSKTRLFVTHELFLLPQVDMVSVFHEGHCVVTATHSTLLQSEDLIVIRSIFTSHEKKLAQKGGSVRLDDQPSGKVDEHKIIKPEDRATGHVASLVLRRYFQFGGMGLVWLALLLFCGGETVNVFVTYNNKEWSQSADQTSWLIIGQLVALLSGSIALGALRLVALYTFFVRAGRALHHAMLQGVVYSPMAFFQANPVGRVLNRFSKDTQVVDLDLPLQARDFVESGTACFFAFVVICVSSPISMSCLPLVVPGFFYYRALLLKTSVQVKRLEALANSPVLSHFSNSLHGLETLRSFNMQRPMQDQFFRFIEDNLKTNVCFYGVSRWMVVECCFHVVRVWCVFLGANVFCFGRFI
jgi:ATP-binding cassette subfamily C (CFTR/MRP) protein 4